MKRYLIPICALFFTLAACDDFVVLDPPRTDLVRKTTFATDETSKAAVLDMYYKMRQGGFAAGDFTGIAFLGSLSSDEQLSYYVSTPTATAEIQQYNDNALLATSGSLLSLWTDLYANIYRANSILEGLTNSTTVTDSLSAQLRGEALVVRAFAHFYLVNLFGDVPLVLTTDYRTNATIPRTPVATVYAQLITDLELAESLLHETYVFSNHERVRPNKFVAAALLARVQLFAGNWSAAAQKASTVIDHTALYNLVPLATVFNTNSREAIWQFWHSARPTERSTFRFPITPNRGAIRSQFYDAFETSDQRRSVWINVTASGFYSTNKYPSTSDAPPLQYATAVRLAEMHLIRAEARAREGNVAGAQEDLNIIRTRAGLPATSANDESTLLAAIEQERRSELFNEWGHRWLDLKRLDRADAVLAPLKPQWQSTAVLFPIPEYELLNNPMLAGQQNPGYE